MIDIGSNVYYSKELDSRYLDLLRREFEKAFAGCRTLAVKLHMGEPGNKTAFVPDDLEPIIALLKDMGFDVFLFDSPVMYRSRRRTEEGYLEVVREKGWPELAPVVVSNEVVEVEGEYMTYGVCRPLVDADGVLVITHVKGHNCSGFGGAIKNLGMGALSRETKRAIHEGGEPIFTGDCMQCGACEEACPIGAITLEDHPIVDGCYGCSNCTYACPLELMKPKVAPFDALLAGGAAAAQSLFKKKYYVSYIGNITRSCDCDVDPGPIIARDIGWIAGEDGVALDWAARNMVVDSAGEDVFYLNNKKTGKKHVQHAERLGMGSMEYNIVDAPQPSHAKIL